MSFNVTAVDTWFSLLVVWAFFVVFVFYWVVISLLHYIIAQWNVTCLIFGFVSNKIIYLTSSFFDEIIKLYKILQIFKYSLNILTKQF